MKIKYQFATETAEIEVDEEWGNLLIDLDRREYNNDHKETRNHCSLEGYNLDGNLIPSNEDVEGTLFGNEELPRVYEAIEKLKPRFKFLIVEVCLKGRKLKDVAAELGITPASAHESLARAKNKLINLLEKP